MIRRALPDVLVALLLALLPLAAALAGSGVEQALVLNLGPGDGPYVAGFTPEYEVESNTGTHWTTYDAAVSIPVSFRGGLVDVVYRFARVMPQTAVVDVSAGGRGIDHFTCRGGIYEERRATIDAASAVPATVAFKVDSHDRRNMGLKMDWVRFETRSPARVRLAGWALVRGALLVVILFALLRGAGWSRRAAAAFSAPFAVALAVGLCLRPWLVHRLLTGLPETLAVLGAIAVAAGRRLQSRGRAEASDVRAVLALLLVAFVLRAAAVNHPDFYYPDLMLHARLTEMLREVGPRFLLTPAVYLQQHGGWSKPAYGGTSGLPYSPAFHTLIALLPLDYDSTLTAFKLGAAAISTLPIAALWALSRRLGASPIGAGLMVLIPTYTSRLSFALLPALFGHAADMGLLLWLAGHVDRLQEKRIFAAGAILVGACQLAYVSSVVNMSLFLGVLAVALALTGRAGLRRGLLVLAMGLCGSAVAVAVFYRDFLGMAVDLLGRMHGRGIEATTRYPVESWLTMTYVRTRDFFGGLYPLLAAVGFVCLMRRGRGRPLLCAWLATYLLLLLLRAKIPDVFRYGHETLFFTPFICLASGEALALILKEAKGRILTILILGVLAWQGFFLQWHALSDQFGNAR